MKKTLRFSSSLGFIALLGAPLIAFAQSGINTGMIQPYADSIKVVINNILLPVLIAVAFIVFLYGVFKYFILGADNDTDRSTGRQFILWGIIGFVVIFSVWGLVALVSDTLGVSTGSASQNALTPPTI